MKITSSRKAVLSGPCIKAPCIFPSLQQQISDAPWFVTELKPDKILRRQYCMMKMCAAYFSPPMSSFATSHTPSASSCFPSHCGSCLGTEVLSRHTASPESMTLQQCIWLGQERPNLNLWFPPCHLHTTGELKHSKCNYRKLGMPEP